MFFFQRDEEKSFMAQLVELGLVETLNDSEMKSSGSPGGKTQSALSSEESLNAPPGKQTGQTF